MPDNEIHELGLMFINHEIVSKGYQSIFLGQSVPIESLTELQQYYQNITYISYFTIKPEKDEVENYIDKFNNFILKTDNTKFWILGQMLNVLNLKSLPKNVTPFKSIKTLTDQL